MTTRCIGLTLALLFAGSVASPTPARGGDKDNLEVLSYAELGKRVRSLEGKVAVVYFWSFG
jgi:hypothetical protein